MATKKSALKSAVSSSSNRVGARPKTLARATGLRVAKPLTSEELAQQQADVAALVDAAREAGDADELEALRAQLLEVRAARYGMLHAERAIRRGDGTFPASLVEKDSTAIKQSVIAALVQHFNYERSRAKPDAARVQAIEAALQTARQYLDE